MLTEKQAFVIGFLRRCVEGGMTLTEVDQTVKQAEGGWLDSLGKLIPTGAGAALGYGAAGTPGAVAGGIVGALPPSAIPLLMGGAIAGGGALGYGAGTLRDALDEQHPDEMQQRDVINRYNVALRNLQLRRHIAEEARARAGRRAHWRG